MPKSAIDAESSGFLALIPVREGSKGIPGENLKEVGGIPLVARTIRIALASEKISRVMVSTDSPEIARLVVAEGAEVPYLRLRELAGDETMISEVLSYTFSLTSRDEKKCRDWSFCRPLRPF